MGKYQYEISFEKAIEAGVSKEEYSRESSKNCILTWIANELAESNRLTILKMKLNHGIITSKDILKEELEDKA